ncbi:restriction endonuclease [Micromonospora sp. NPDC051296]|uniref:nSTAND3 domain-containing NTPase n=1 Tax=Micromonospora sp. NPDC051296 TaxID=3155046 RepID=UPI00341D007A
MDDIDITRLSAFDFEVLCADLFGEILGARLEVFAPGADRGIDLRHMSARGDVIVQCKHYSRSGRSALLSHMEKIEAAKVRALKPAQYILATSAGLTVHAKEELVEKLSPYLAKSDIYGIDEIVVELRKRPQLVERHIRLWLSGTAVLRAVLNKTTLTRTSRLLRNLDKTLEVFAPHPGLNEAQRLLEARGVCVISGMPGIGKTTLAQVLCASYVRAGYDLYDISADANEVNAVWDDDARQVFFCDDFLGRSAFGDKLGRNADARLVDVLKQVELSENKRMVLTTRGYILEQARQVSEPLERYAFDRHSFVLDLADHQFATRAAILYNQVYFSRLADDPKAAFASPDVYLDVIRDPNFNPRVIEDTLTIAAQDGLTASAAVEVLRHNLNDPDEVWRPIFRNQLTSHAGEVMEILLLLGDGVTSDDLFRAWHAYSNSPAREVHQPAMEDALRILDRTMIQMYGGSPCRVYFSNPSVEDYLRKHVEKAPATVARLIRTAPFFEQIERAWLYARESPTLRRMLADHLQDLAAAVKRTYDAEPVDCRDLNVLHRVNVTLAIADAFAVAELYTFAEEKLRNVDLTDDIDDLAEAVESSVLCNRSPSKVLRQVAARLSQRIAAEVTEDLPDWSSVERAVAFLEQLHGLPGHEALATAEAAREATARATIDAIGSAGLGRISGVSLRELADIIDYADQWDHFSPYMDDVRQSLAIVEMEEARESELADYYSGDAENEELADRMFSLLRDVG